MVYTLTKARQNLSAILEAAIKEGQVKIRRKDGRVFTITPESTDVSPLDVKGLNLLMQRSEILSFVQEGRKFQ